jgi:hypothetical protein
MTKPIITITSCGHSWFHHSQIMVLNFFYDNNFDFICIINVREYRRGNQKYPIQRNWQHMVHKTKKNKTKTQHNMRCLPLYANKHK